VAAAEGAGELWPALGVFGGKFGGALLIAIVTLVNYFGLQAGAGLQNAIAAVKIVAMLALIVFGLAATPQTVTTASTAVSTGGISIGALGVAMIGVLWCFDGWYQAAFCAGEIRDPARNLPRGMIVGALATAVLFLLINVVYLRALPPQELGAASRIGEAAAHSLFGAGPARLMAVAVLISIVGCLATCILTAARIYLPMAQDGLFFHALAKIHPVHLTPGACLIAQAAWSILLVYTGSYEQLGTYVIFAVFVFHAATGAAIFVLRRRRPDWPRPYRAWGYPWTPLVFIVTALAFVFNTLVERPIESLWGLGIVVLGVPAYAWWRRGQRQS
jgi:APA family basic amino acid/polyamine antiporter